MSSAISVLLWFSHDTNPNAVVGHLGKVVGIADVAELSERLGVNTRRTETGADRRMNDENEKNPNVLISEQKFDSFENISTKIAHGTKLSSSSRIKRAELQ